MLLWIRQKLKKRENASEKIFKQKKPVLNGMNGRPHIEKPSNWKKCNYQMESWRDYSSESNRTDRGSKNYILYGIVHYSSRKVCRIGL